MKITSKKITAIRHAMNETQVEFAKRFERSFSTIKRWESGSSEPVFHEVLYIQSLIKNLET